LEVDQAGDVLALAAGGGVGNFVDLQPEHAPAVGEDQHVVVRGGEQQVLDEVLRTRTHADAALPASRLAAVGGDAGAVKISAARHRYGDVLLLHQVFEADLAGVFDDLGAALVAVVLLDLLQLLDDEILENLVRAQDFEVFGDAALDLSQFLQDLPLLHS